MSTAKRLETRAYDLILSDVLMPELDGPGLYRELERRDPQACRRVVFLTGGTFDEQVTEFLGSSGRPCLSKPFRLDEVRQVIRGALGA